jgi:hypothetical protein
MMVTGRDALRSTKPSMIDGLHGAVNRALKPEIDVTDEIPQ